MADDEQVEDWGTEMVQVDFTLGIDGASLGIQSMVPAGLTNLTQLLPVVQSLDSLIVNTVGEQLKAEGKSISCRPGCASCCRQMVPISLFEAEALGEWIRSLPEQEQAVLQGRFHAVLESLSRSGMIDRLVTEDWFADTQATHAMALEYFQQGLACPFLVEENCSIHPFRPLACREYVVTSPAEHCFHPLDLQVDGVRLTLKLSRALYRMGTEIDGGSRGWIPLVFLLAWMKGGFKPGAAYAGTGPEVLYQFLQRVAVAPSAAEDGA